MHPGKGKAVCSHHLKSTLKILAGEIRQEKEAKHILTRKEVQLST